MWDDPIVAETRQVRDQIASRFEYKIRAIGEYFKTKRASDAVALIEKMTAQTKKQSLPVTVTKPPRKKKSTIQKVETTSA